MAGAGRCVAGSVHRRVGGYRHVVLCGVAVGFGYSALSCRLADGLREMLVQRVARYSGSVETSMRSTGPCSPAKAVSSITVPGWSLSTIVASQRRSSPLSTSPVRVATARSASSSW